MITTYRDEASRLIVHFDTDHTAPTRFVVWLEGKSTTIVGKPGELPSAVWQRVVNSVRQMREGFARVERMTPKQRHPSMHWGNPYRMGSVYAGIDPTPQQAKEHLTQWVIQNLYKIAESPSSTPMQQVHACSALAEITGLVKPDPKRPITIVLT